MRTLAAATLLAALAVTPAMAEPIAQVSGGNVAVRTGPGSQYRIIGALTNGTQVLLDYCTTDDEWCHVADLGWVDAAWIVGWSAKIAVTPPGFLSNPTVEQKLF
ncbi:SH3 domain-containing protein [Devosia soli]|uniref:SH3 domain-containing protein n=1 Tax=Devosia soli TaxID=361041 RepID=UPI00069A43D4|nr:SH3 domain-containing protein [Devosia soli]